MSATDKRVAELLDRWMASVELHARYLDLDDDAYAKAQAWPKHQRPTGWILELARARLVELQRIAAERRTRGDAGFAEALELMAFLTSLVGSEHVARFVPLAEPQPPQAVKPKPRLEPARPVETVAAPRSRRPSPARSPVRATAEPRRPAAGNDAMTATVIADAARLVSWGREWPQLAGLIARLASRPPETEVWQILRRHRADIEALARKPRD